MLSTEDHELFKTYYHSETKYYIDRLERYLDGKTNSFNVKMLFISVLYLSYRKMFKWVGIFFLVSFVFGLLQSVFLSGLLSDFVDYDTAYAIEKLTDLAFLIVFASYTNRLYIEKSIRDIDKIKAQTSDHEERLKLAAKTGGVNWVVPLILILVPMLIWAYLANS